MTTRSDSHTETREYTVTGMTCSHCVESVSEEVSEVAGVAEVDVDLESGRLTVTGTELDDDAVRAAVSEAGYETAGKSPTHASDML